MKAAQGMLLGNRYLLLELLATGGMGEVWTARDQAVGRTVAVKVLRDEYTGNLEFLRRLRTEARNSAALAHPNIAQMFDYGEEEGTGYLVMELVPGESLADLLDRQPVLPASLLIPILADTARGLEHAHLNSVVHRDVKPGNILLEHVLPSAPPVVKITDFGVSLAANQAPMTATGMVMGTAQYLSPEQAVGRPATPRSDLYALGVIAYEAAAGRRPFSGKSPVDIAIAHVNDDVPPLPASVDPALAEIIMRLLIKEPEQRHATAGELAAELDAISPHASKAMAAPATRVIAAPPPRPSVDPPADAEARAAELRHYPSRVNRRAPTPPTTIVPPAAVAPPVFPPPATMAPIPRTPDVGAPIRRSVRRPVSPVGQAPRVGSARPPGLGAVAAPPRLIRSKTVVVEAPPSSSPHPNAPRGAPGAPGPSKIAKDQRRPHPAVLVAAAATLILILYLIVRHFNAAPPVNSGQSALLPGTIGLALPMLAPKRRGATPHANRKRPSAASGRPELQRKL